ncbi:MAG: ABC transporter permease [Crocinitomicaceae bacterium]|jgi:sodium transport system permease protein|nr:ABC transporter permease [Crocinitomicaceae bacterium]MDG2464405.1 ABC transporter permease [Crocinitomicaceae bacterium]
MILKIFLKELKDTLRDKRTLMMMIVIPVLIFPIILYITAGISNSFEKEAATKSIKIGFIGDAESAVIQEFMHMPKNLGKFDLEPYADQTTLEKDVKNDSLQMGLIVPNDYLENERSMKPVKCTVIYNATDLGISDRAEKYMELVEKNAEKKRYKALELDEEKLQPIVTEYKNIASKKEMIGKLAGGILPYVFIAFGFIGCMYPAIDLFTGEKERGTIETLLTTPVSRIQILIGKMAVVVLSGLLAATSALVGLFFAIKVMSLEGNAQIMDIVQSILTPGFVLMLFFLLFPLTVFFAGVMVPIAVYAKSFKEAQSIITPLNIAMVLPAMVGLFPGIELNIVTACIPVVNIVLSTKELIAGTLEPSLLFLSFGIMVALAMVAVFISYKRFDKETNVVL